MARFIPSNAMAGVGNIERLALMKQQAAIEEAQKPTVMDRLTKVGGELINYVADKAQYEFKAKQIQTQADAKRKTDLLELKVKEGLPVNDEDLQSLGIKDRAEWDQYMAQKEKLARDKAQREWALKNQIGKNPKTGKNEYFMINPDPNATERITWTGIEPVDKLEASRERMDMQMAKAAADYVYKAVVEYDPFTSKPVINQKKLAAKIKEEKNPLVKYYLGLMRTGEYEPEVGAGDSTTAPAGYHFELDPVTGEKNLVKD